MFQVFSGVSYVCLQVFNLDVAYVCNGFKCFQVFLQVFQTLILSISSVFFMLQLLHLDISKVDRVLHMGCVWETAGSAGNVQDEHRAHC